MVAGNERDVSSWLRYEALERVKERAVGGDDFFQFDQSSSGIYSATLLVGLHE